MEFDDIRCLLETPTGSTKRRTESKIKSTKCAEKILPVSILKTGTSPAKINQKTLISGKIRRISRPHFVFFGEIFSFSSRRSETFSVRLAATVGRISLVDLIF